MKRLLILTSLAVLLGACQRTTRYEQTTGAPLTVTSLDGIQRTVRVENERLDSSGEYPVCRIELLNTGRRGIHCELQATWFDATGGELRDLTRHWRPVALAAGARSVQEFQAPAAAERCEIVLRKANAVEN